MPVAAKPAGAPAPPDTAPEEAVNAQVVAPVAVDCSPEEYCLALPLLGDEVRISEQVVEDVGVYDALLRQLLAKLVARGLTGVGVGSVVEWNVKNISIYRYISFPSPYFPPSFNC